MAKDASNVQFVGPCSEDGWSSSEDSSSDQGGSDGDEEKRGEETKRCKRSRREEELEFRTRAGFGSELTYQSVKDVLCALGFDAVLREKNMNTSDWDEFLQTCDIDNGSFWSLYGMAASAYLCGVATLAMCTKPEVFFRTNFLGWEQGAHWLKEHPVWLGRLVFVKGTHITINLMCIRPLGECIMPAYAALKHRSSRGLLLVLFLMYCNAVMTYHALPVQVCSPDKPKFWDPFENLFQTAMLLFRVTFLGELDPNQLEAQNLRVSLKMTEENATGHILAPAELSSYHHSVQVISLAFVILIHVMLLSVYSQFERTERELFEKFSAIFTRMTLFRYSWCIRRLRKCRRRKEWGRHVWIAFNSSLFKDPLLEQERCEDKTSTLKRQEMDAVRLLRIFQKLVPSLASSMCLAQAEGTLYERGLPVVQVVPKDNCKVSLLFWEGRWLREHSRDADRIHTEFEASAR